MGKYCVTGGAGFIGSHLVDRLLRDGHGVRVVDDLSTGERANLPAGIDFHQGDVGDPTVVRRALAGVDGCFHLAAVASVVRCNEEWSVGHRTNQSATVAVMAEAARLGGLPVVYASSAAVYGDIGREVAAEDRRPAPQTAYGVDKLGSELHGAIAWSIHRVPTLGLRFFNVYGPRQSAGSPYSGVIALFARLLGEERPITVYGDGTQSRDFVFVDDVVDHLSAGMARLGQRPGAEVLNVCTGHPTTILALASTIAAGFGREPRSLAGPVRAGDIGYSVGDPTRAVTALGIRASTPLSEGLRFLAGAGRRAA